MGRRRQQLRHWGTSTGNRLLWLSGHRWSQQRHGQSEPESALQYR